MIAPRDIEDLRAIAKATGDSVLEQKVEEVYGAASIVHGAHVNAGKILSEQLQTQIADMLNKHESIDPYNIWSPIELRIDGFGVIRILKVIDIGEQMLVDLSDANRIIKEWE